MGKQLNHIPEKLKGFIEKQHLFFVGTAAEDGRVNVSPKGMDTLRILDSNKVIWLNLTGSGNETAAHLLKNARMTLMFCAFEGKPMILRLYGHAKCFHPRDVEFHSYRDLFPKDCGARQIIEMNVDLVQTSCGFAVPLMEFKENRNILKEWSDSKGPEGIEQYWEEKNQTSIDGFETRILSD